MKIKQYYLIFAFVAVLLIALLYGVSPQWFARTFLNVPVIPLDFAHILRSVMCLYLALGLFCVDRGLISATFAANLSRVSGCELHQIG